MIGHSSLSIMALLTGESRGFTHELVIGLPGCEPVGTVRVVAEALERVALD